MKRILILVIVLLAFILFAAGADEAADRPEDKNATKIHENYKKVCATCHNWDRGVTRGMTRAEWKSTIERMRVKHEKVFEGLDTKELVEAALFFTAEANKNPEKFKSSGGCSYSPCGDPEGWAFLIILSFGLWIICIRSRGD